MSQLVDKEADVEIVIMHTFQVVNESSGKSNNCHL